MSIQLQEIKNIFIKNRLTEGVDFKRYESGTFTVEGDVTPETHTGLQQIYQNKLIEGEDYETADWLCGRNGAYIDTNYIVSQTDHINCHYKYDGTLKNPDGQEQDIFCMQSTLIQHFCRAYINSANKLSVQFFEYVGNWYSTNKNILDGNITDLHIKGQEYYFSVNGKSYKFPTNFETFNADRSIWLFNRDSESHKYFHGDIASFSIKDATNVDKVNMIPCTLLCSIPRNLDAQCKERVAGECGMIDLISGKFYGNVANSGTFTVENENNE